MITCIVRFGGEDTHVKRVSTPEVPAVGSFLFIPESWRGAVGKDSTKGKLVVVTSVRWQPVAGDVLRPWVYVGGYEVCEDWEQ